MKKLNSTHFRRIMSSVFDECEESNEPVLITTNKAGRKDKQRMIVISEEQYIMMINRVNEVNNEK